MFCANCGKEIADGTKFCPNCGQEVGGKVKSESAFAGIAKAASEKIGGLQNKVKEMNEKEEEAEKNKVDPVAADGREYQSITEIITQKKESIFNVQGKSNAQSKTTSFKLRNEISNLKLQWLTKRVAKNKITTSDILAVYDNKEEGTIVFTDYAMYVSEKMMLPVVVKYTDITEIGVDKNDEKQAIVRLSNELELTIKNDKADMKALAQIIKTISEFAKKRGEDEKCKSIVSSAEQEMTLLLKVLGFGFFTAIFSWNSYVIFHNISIGQGLIWTILGIIINLAILYPLVGYLAVLLESITKNTALVEKIISKKLIFVYPLILLLVFGSIGHSSYKTYLAENAKKIIEQNSFFKVEKVVNIQKTSKNIYSGIAILESGYTLDVVIKRLDNGDILCQWGQ